MAGRRPHVQPWRRRHTGRYIAIGLFVALIVGISALLLIPVQSQVHYQFRIVDPGTGTDWFYQNQSLCPSGSGASMNYTVENGTFVQLTVFDPNGGTVWSTSGTHGWKNFSVRYCGSYAFRVYDLNPETVDFNLTLTRDVAIL